MAKGGVLSEQVGESDRGRGGRVAPDRGSASDEALIAATASGDEAAFERLVTRHAPRVRALALRQTGRAADADDIAQEAFLRVWRNAGRFSPEAGAFRSWLYRIVANLCLDAGRWRSRWRWTALEEAPEPATEAADPARGLGDRQALERARAAVRDLPERQRMAVLMSAVAGLSNPEIAEALGSTTAAVEQLVSRGRKRLRRQAKDEGWAPGGSGDEPGVQRGDEPGKDQER
ncbi:MAG: sigma-70 family RNA polymerase sigma factor [Pseudomonadota bacterium]